MACCSSTDSWWRHQTEAFSALLAFCAGNSQVTGEFPAQRQVTLSRMFSLISAWINDSVNNREAGNFKRRRTHYDGIVMLLTLVIRQIFPLHLAISLTEKTVDVTVKCWLMWQKRRYSKNYRHKTDFYYNSTFVQISSMFARTDIGRRSYIEFLVATLAKLFMYNIMIEIAYRHLKVIYAEKKLRYCSFCKQYMRIISRQCV